MLLMHIELFMRRMVKILTIRTCELV